MLRIFEYLADIRFKGLYAFLIGITVFSVCFKGDLSEQLPDELQSEENGAVTAYQSPDDVSETEPKAARALAAANTDRTERHQPHSASNENNNTDEQNDNIMLLSDEIPLGETASNILENETNAGEDTEEAASKSEDSEALDTEEDEDFDPAEETEIAEDDAESSEVEDGETEAEADAAEIDTMAETDPLSDADTESETDTENEANTAAETTEETETENATEAAESYGINPRYGQREQMQWERDYAAQVVEITNQVRAEYGLAPLKQLDALTAAAVERAWEVTFNMSHNRPDGTRCFSVLDQYGLSSPTAKGENIAMWSYTPQMVVNSWMNDKAHRDAILSAEYEYIGVGCYYIENDYYHYYWTQIFYTP